MGRVVAFGECMVELSLSDVGTAEIGYAGDTFNTAVYLSRLGRRVACATALGAGDRFSRAILARMADEGIDTDLVVEAEGRLPGLYAIERDPEGERSFLYWRGEAPVRDFFRLADLDRLARALREAELIYLSGISLAVVGEAGRARLLELVAEAARAGVPVAFDPNYRPRLWDSSPAARAAVEAMVGLCRFVSFAGADVEALFAESGDVLGRAWASAGAEVVQRDADRSVHVHRAGATSDFPGQDAARVVDTTGAGDSFNAAYLATRLAGGPPERAVAAAQALAGLVVAWPGAIIPRSAHAAAAPLGERGGSR